MMPKVGQTYFIKEKSSRREWSYDSQGPILTVTRIEYLCGIETVFFTRNIYVDYVPLEYWNEYAEEDLISIGNIGLILYD